jgi:hypothetical protein
MHLCKPPRNSHYPFFFGQSYASVNKPLGEAPLLSLLNTNKALFAY